MKISQAANLWSNYHRANSSKNTIRACKELLERFCQKTGDKDLKELTSDDALDFLNGITEGKKPQTRKKRFSNLTSFSTSQETTSIRLFKILVTAPLSKRCSKPMC